MTALPPYITDLPWLVQTIFGSLAVGLALGVFAAISLGRR